MPNIVAILNDQIRRLARREIRATAKIIKRSTGHYRRDIAALKREVAQVLKQVAALKKQLPDQPQLPPPEAVKGARLRIDGLKAHRARLGLSAKDYGKLMGVSGLTIYNWEAGKSKPRRSQLPRIVAVRGIGKREAMQRLGMGKEAESETAAGIPPVLKALKGRNGGAGYTRRVPHPVYEALRTLGPGERRTLATAVRSPVRSPFKQTAEGMILGLLRGRKALTTAEINREWAKEGRAGRADVALGMMTKARKLKRAKLKGQRGSAYRAG